MSTHDNEFVPIVVHVPTMRWCTYDIWKNCSISSEPKLDWKKIENKEIFEEVALTLMLDVDNVLGSESACINKINIRMDMSPPQRYPNFKRHYCFINRLSNA